MESSSERDAVDSTGSRSEELLDDDAGSGIAAQAAQQHVLAGLLHLPRRGGEGMIPPPAALKGGCCEQTSEDEDGGLDRGLVGSAPRPILFGSLEGLEARDAELEEDAVSVEDEEEDEELGRDRDSVGRDSVGRDSVGRDSVGRDSVGHDSDSPEKIGAELALNQGLHPARKVSTRRGPAPKKKKKKKKGSKSAMKSASAMISIPQPRYVNLSCSC